MDRGYFGDVRGMQNILFGNVVRNVAATLWFLPIVVLDGMGKVQRFMYFLSPQNTTSLKESSSSPARAWHQQRYVENPYRRQTRRQGK
jgi:hypothetical protein